MSVPTLDIPDGMVGFLHEGCTFTGSRYDRFDTESFRIRLAGRPAICARYRRSSP